MNSYTKSQLINYVYKTIELSNYKYKLLETENDLESFKESEYKYFVSANFTGINCLLVFEPIHKVYFLLNSLRIFVVFLLK